MGVDSYFVVYLLIPTSNHNPWLLGKSEPRLYIFWFLHQTTTKSNVPSSVVRCISFDSYIKPQLRFEVPLIGLRCISFDSYIKPQRWVSKLGSVVCCISFDSYIKPQLIVVKKTYSIVVYLLIPTSNHNMANIAKEIAELYIFWFLHQTTTSHLLTAFRQQLYIFWFLHQTTTNYQ